MLSQSGFSAFRSPSPAANRFAASRTLARRFAVASSVGFRLLRVALVAAAAALISALTIGAIAKESGKRNLITVS